MRSTARAAVATTIFEQDEDLKSIFTVRLRDQCDLIADFLITRLHVTMKKTAE